MDAYLSGDKLYGDDLSPAEIEAWFEDEAEGYYSLAASGSASSSYGYGALNDQHGFAHLTDQRFDRVLGVGAAHGAELQPILNRAGRVTILEPADGFARTALNGVPVDYVKPLPSGLLPFESGSFDLLTCLGVLHHIPNVTTVVREFARVMRTGGHALIREPIISMGDWRQPRRRLTKRERGIPLPLLRNAITDAGFEVVSEKRCMFSLTSRLRHVIRAPAFDNKVVVYMDAVLCALPVWSKAYHARTIFQKLRPTSVFYVIRKIAT